MGRVSFGCGPFRCSRTHMRRRAHVHHAQRRIVVGRFSTLNFLGASVGIGSIAHKHIHCCSISFDMLTSISILMRVVVPRAALFHSFVLCFTCRTAVRGGDGRRRLGPTSTVGRRTTTQVCRLLDRICSRHHRCCGSKKLAKSIGPRHSGSTVRLRRGGPVRHGLTGLTSCCGSGDVGGTFLTCISRVLARGGRPRGLVCCFLSFSRASSYFKIIGRCLGCFALRCDCDDGD